MANVAVLDLLKKAPVTRNVDGGLPVGSGEEIYCAITGDRVRNAVDITGTSSVIFRAMMIIVLLGSYSPGFASINLFTKVKIEP